MILLDEEQQHQLLLNGTLRAGDHIPVVKLFTPDGNATWLLTEIDPSHPTHAFGLCYLGHGYPELGYVSLGELSVLRGIFGLKVERDDGFVPQFPVSIYAAAARDAGKIVTDERVLSDVAQKQKVPKTPGQTTPRPT